MDSPTSTRYRSNMIVLLSLLGAAALLLLARLSVPDETMPSGTAVIRPPGEVSALAVQDGIVWAGGRDGLLAVDRSTLAVSPPPGSPPDLRQVRDLLVDHYGSLWVAHLGGLARFSNGVWSEESQVDRLLEGPAAALWMDRDGALWIGGEKGVVVMAPGGPRLLTMADGLATPSVDVIFQDRDGVMWFGSSSATHGGLTSLDAGRWRRFFTQDGLAHSSVNAITQDRTGALWFACGFHDRGGASRLKDGQWTTFTRRDGLAGEKVRTIFEDRTGRLWFASEYDGVAIRDGDRWRTLTPAQGLAAWEVKRIVQDQDGVFWLGTLDGLSRIASID